MHFHVQIDVYVPATPLVLMLWHPITPSTSHTTSYTSFTSSWDVSHRIEALLIIMEIAALNMITEITIAMMGSSIGKPLL
jgi:hypothetical protein